MGAEVIRVDHTAGGLDYNRYMLTAEGRSLSWENLNRAKKSVALDLQSGAGRELCVELAAKTGQLITNLPEQSFLGHAAMAAKRADMVSLRIMGWHDGRQAMDFTVNAAAGYPLMTGPEDWDAQHRAAGQPSAARVGLHHRSLLRLRHARRAAPPGSHGGGQRGACAAGRCRDWHHGQCRVAGRGAVSRRRPRTARQCDLGRIRARFPQP